MCTGLWISCIITRPVLGVHVSHCNINPWSAEFCFQIIKLKLLDLCYSIQCERTNDSILTWIQTLHVYDIYKNIISNHCYWNVCLIINIFEFTSHEPHSLECLSCRPMVQRIVTTHIWAKLFHSRTAFNISSTSLGQRQRHWPIITPSLDLCVMFTCIVAWNVQVLHYPVFTIVLLMWELPRYIARSPIITYHYIGP